MTFDLASFGAMLLRHEAHSEDFVSYPNKYTTYTVYLSLITFIWCFRSVCILKYSTTKTMVPLCSQFKWCDHALNNYVTHERKGNDVYTTTKSRGVPITFFSFIYACSLQAINRALTNQCINLLLTLITLEILKQIPVFEG